MDYSLLQLLQRKLQLLQQHLQRFIPCIVIAPWGSRRWDAPIIRLDSRRWAHEARQPGLISQQLLLTEH